MAEIKTGKVVIVGAGHVGSHCAMCLMLQNEADEVVLVDVNQKLAVTQALDLDDMATNLDYHCVVRAGDYSDCADAEILVITVGKGRVPGQTRLDLLDGTVAIMKSVAKEIEASGFHGILISISNPADIIADWLRVRLDLPRTRVFSTGTSLDTARLKRILSEITGIDRHSIQAFCLGEHGESQFILKDNIFLGGIPLNDFARTHPSLADDLDIARIAELDRKSASEIISGKNSTEFGIGTVLTHIVSAINHDSRRIITLSVHLDGEYGIENAPVGVPCVVGGNGIEEILEIGLTPDDLAKLHHSADITRDYFEKSLAM